ALGYGAPGRAEYGAAGQRNRAADQAGAAAACHDRSACFSARSDHLGDLLGVRGPRDGEQCVRHEGGVVCELLSRVAGQDVLGADYRSQPSDKLAQKPSAPTVVSRTAMSSRKW